MLLYPIWELTSAICEGKTIIAVCFLNNTNMKYKCASCGAHYNGIRCPMCGSVVTTETK